MLMNLSEATDVVKGMLHTFFMHKRRHWGYLCTKSPFFNDLRTKVCTKVGVCARDMSHFDQLLSILEE